MDSRWIAPSRFLPDAPVAEPPDPAVPDKHRLTHAPPAMPVVHRLDDFLRSRQT